MGSCPKCTGYLIDKAEGLACVNCGCHPVVQMPAREVGMVGNVGPDVRRLDAAHERTERLSRRERLTAEGLCVQCGIRRSNPAEPGKTLCAAHAKANRKAAAAWNKKRNKKHAR